MCLRAGPVQGSVAQKRLSIPVDSSAEGPGTTPQRSGAPEGGVEMWRCGDDRTPRRGCHWQRWHSALIVERAAHPVPAAIERAGGDHGCFHILVTEKLLEGADIVAVFQQMGREAMAESGAAGVFSNPRRADGAAGGTGGVVARARPRAHRPARSAVVWASRDSGKDLASNRAGVQQTADSSSCNRQVIGARYDTRSSIASNVQPGDLRCADERETAHPGQRDCMRAGRARGV